jgi:transcription initiation factor IIE alpha subunit
VYFEARVRRMVHYGLDDFEIAKSLDIDVKEVRRIIGLMEPPPVDVRDENHKVLQHRSYLEP